MIKILLEKKGYQRWYRICCFVLIFIIASGSVAKALHHRRDKSYIAVFADKIKSVKARNPCLIDVKGDISRVVYYSGIGRISGFEINDIDKYPTADDEIRGIMERVNLQRLVNDEIFLSVAYNNKKFETCFEKRGLDFPFILLAAATSRKKELSLYQYNYDLAGNTIIDDKVTATEKNPLKLQLPSAVFAVDNQPLEIYFHNLILSNNPANYIFTVKCKYGHTGGASWIYTPKSADDRKFKLVIAVWDHRSRLLGKAATTVYVSQKKTVDMNGKKSVWVLGGRLVDGRDLLPELNKLLTEQGDYNLKFIGSHTGWRRISPNGIKNEAHSGWRWSEYYNGLGKELETYLKNKHNQKSLRKYKFIDILKEYFKIFNNGKAPDIVIYVSRMNFMLFDQYNIDSYANGNFLSAEKIIRALKQLNPNVIIGVVGSIPPALPDAFRACQNKYTYWASRTAQHRYLHRTIKQFDKRTADSIFLIPAYCSFDVKHNYVTKQEPVTRYAKETTLRQYHPLFLKKSGYKQLADSLYCWIKYCLSNNPEQ